MTTQTTEPPRPPATHPVRPRRTPGAIRAEGLSLGYAGEPVVEGVDIDVVARRDPGRARPLGLRQVDPAAGLRGPAAAAGRADRRRRCRRGGAGRRARPRLPGRRPAAVADRPPQRRAAARAARGGATGAAPRRRRVARAGRPLPLRRPAARPALGRDAAAGAARPRARRVARPDLHGRAVRRARRADPRVDAAAAGGDLGGVRMHGRLRHPRRRRGARPRRPGRGAGPPRRRRRAPHRAPARPRPAAGARAAPRSSPPSAGPSRWRRSAPSTPRRTWHDSRPSQTVDRPTPVGRTTTRSAHVAMEIPPVAPTRELTCDVLVVGGGTAGTMAAITAAEAGSDVLLLEKAHVRHSGALAMGMDGVNNAVIPGKADPDDYVAEITRANDGIVNQAHRAPDRHPRLRHGAAPGEVRREVREGRVRRLPRAPGAPVRLVRPPDAGGQGRQEGPLPGDAAPRDPGAADHREPADAGPGAHLGRPGGRRRGVRHPLRRVRHGRAPGGHPRHRRLRPARAAGQRLPLRHLREPDQRRRRPRDGLPRRRRAQRDRVLPGQPADQGLQRPRLRVRREPVRRLPGQLRGGPVRRLRLLVGPDDGRGEGGDRLRPRADLPQAQPPARRDDHPARGDPPPHRAAHPRHLPRRPGPRLPHPRRRDAHLRDRAVRRPLLLRRVGRRARADHGARACTPPATWPASRTTT